MQVLILGGTGAMGMPLAQILSLAGNEVFITSRSYHPNTEKIKYITGDALDDKFIRKVLEEKYDVIVDFMIYSVNQLQSRIDAFLDNTSQYIFTSSCRVYAPSDEPITEESPRLLDVCQDKEYLKTNEYALEKAREENIIISSKRKNWTIIRPSVTYNVGRLQLGCYEACDWLSRIMRGKAIVFQNDLKTVFTPMTYGDDVSMAISHIIGNQDALGEIIHIASPETQSWNDILSIYMKALYENGIDTNLIWQDSSLTASRILGRVWQRKYAKLINRCFDSSKINKICGYEVEYTPISDGLKKCVNQTINSNKCWGVNYMIDAYQDRITKEKMLSTELCKVDNVAKYYICRYTPYLKLRFEDYSEK